MNLSQANNLDELIEMEDIIKSSSIYKGGGQQYEFIEFLGEGNWKNYLIHNVKADVILK